MVLLEVVEEVIVVEVAAEEVAEAAAVVVQVVVVVRLVRMASAEVVAVAEVALGMVEAEVVVD